jgi:hypothetical protein
VGLFRPLRRERLSLHVHRPSVAGMRLPFPRALPRDALATPSRAPSGRDRFFRDPATHALRDLAEHASRSCGPEPASRSATPHRPSAIHRPMRRTQRRCSASAPRPHRDPARPPRRVAQSNPWRHLLARQLELPLAQESTAFLGSPRNTSPNRHRRLHSGDGLAGAVRGNAAEHHSQLGDDHDAVQGRAATLALSGAFRIDAGEGPRKGPLSRRDQRAERDGRGGQAAAAGDDLCRSLFACDRWVGSAMPSRDSRKQPFAGFAEPPAPWDIQEQGRFRRCPRCCVWPRSRPARPAAFSVDSAAPERRVARIWLGSYPARSACAAGGPRPHRSAHATWRALNRPPHGSHARVGDVPDRDASRRGDEPKMLQILARASPGELIVRREHRA